MTAPQIFAVNARFLTREASGVDRVAIELLKALARRPEVAGLILLHPRCETLQSGWLEELSAVERAKFTLRQIGRLRGHPWEQLELVGAEPGRLLLSLCSSGPILRRHQAVMIHDAQVWDAKASFSRAFRAGYRLLLPLLARRARHLLTVSDFARGRLEALGIAPRGKPKVVHNGADHILRIAPDPGTLARHGLRAGGYLFAIGNLAPHKNLKRLTEAAAAREQGSNGAPELILAGGMNSKVFADAGLTPAEGTRFIGRVSDGELRALYEGALALVFPSLTEGFGLPPLEAMLCGCPVLASTGGAVPEICGDAVLAVPPEDTAGWTAAMARISTDPALRAELARRGKARAAAYAWDGAASALLGILGASEAGRRSQ